MSGRLFLIHFKIIMQSIYWGARYLQQGQFLLQTKLPHQYLIAKYNDLLLPCGSIFASLSPPGIGGILNSLVRNL